MGLLDDAIREHLDLKRRRGADPAEVARLEHEALGPVRREPTGAEPAAEPPAAEPSPDATHVLAPEDRHEPPHGDPLREAHGDEGEHPGGSADARNGGIEGEEAAAEAEASQPTEAVAPEPEAAHADRAGGAGEDDSATPLAESPRAATGPARSAADPEHEAPQEEDPRYSDIVHQPTTEFRVEDHHDEDVLEETPDFLQETPEHDRLWFEQRPPRDFDFDG